MLLTSQIVFAQLISVLHMEFLILGCWNELNCRYLSVCIGSPTYVLAKYLAEILKPVVGKSEHYVVNSKEFVTKIYHSSILSQSKQIV